MVKAWNGCDGSVDGLRADALCAVQLLWHLFVASVKGLVQS